MGSRNEGKNKKMENKTVPGLIHTLIREWKIKCNINFKYMNMLIKSRIGNLNYSTFNTLLMGLCLFDLGSLLILNYLTILSLLISLSYNFYNLSIYFISLFYISRINWIYPFSLADRIILSIRSGRISNGVFGACGWTFGIEHVLMGVN